MAGSNPQLWFLALLGACIVLGFLGNVATWLLSRAHKVRALEDRILEAVRVQRERSDQVDVRLSEWQVTITSILAEVEDFFERSVKERKRAMLAANKAETLSLTQPVQPGIESMDGLPRAAQLELVRQHFEGR